MNNRKFFAGAAAAALMLGLGIGAVQAQTYVALGGPETVYVHPIPDRIHRQSVAPGTSGYLYAEKVSASRRIDVSDINLSRPAGWRMLRVRIADTARDLCSGLVSTDRWNFDRDEYRHCVIQATDNAMRDASLS